jgi:hypothetical protein
MTSFDIILDAIAEMIALEPNMARSRASSSLESIVFALSQERRLNEKELRADLETRIHLIQVNQRRIGITSGELSKDIAEPDGWSHEVTPEHHAAAAFGTSATRNGVQ